MKPTLYLLVLSLLFSVQLFGQSFNYSLVKDSPLPVLKVHVDVMSADLWSTNFANMGAGLRADFVFNRRFSVYGSYKRSVFLDAIEAEGAKFFPENGLVPHGYTELNGYFHFRSKSEKGSVKIALSTTFGSGKNKGSTKYAIVNATTHKFLSLKGGLHNFKTSMPLGGFNLQSGDLIKQSTFWSTLSDTSTIGVAATNQYSTFGAVGISRKKVHNVSASTTKYGTIRANNLSEIYFDIFLGMSTKFDDVVIEDRTFSPVFENIKKGGWRMGWRKSMNYISMNMEFGVRPGPKQKGEDMTLPTRGYMLMSFGFVLGSTFGKTGIKS